MSFKPILVVEDDEDIRRQVIQALKSEGYKVFSAENGLEALELLKALPKEELPKCMILDLMMPVMDGKTMLAKIDSDFPEFKSIHVIVATAKGSPINLDSIPQTIHRIQKPFELDELYRSVEDCCRKINNFLGTENSDREVSNGSERR